MTNSQIKRLKRADKFKALALAKKLESRIHAVSTNFMNGHGIDASLASKTASKLGSFLKPNKNNGKRWTLIDGIWIGSYDRSSKAKTTFRSDAICG